MLWSRLWLQEPIQMWGHACFDVFGATGLANVETVFIMVCWVCYILALFKPPVDKRSDHSGRPALSFAAQCACAFVFNKKHALLQSCSKHFGAKADTALPLQHLLAARANLDAAVATPRYTQQDGSAQILMVSCCHASSVEKAEDGRTALHIAIVNAPASQRPDVGCAFPTSRYCQSESNQKKDRLNLCIHCEWGLGERPSSNKAGRGMFWTVVYLVIWWYVLRFRFSNCCILWGWSFQKHCR